MTTMTVPGGSSGWDSKTVLLKGLQDDERLADLVVF